MAKVLLFNFDQSDKLNGIKSLSASVGAEIVSVRREQHGLSLDELLEDVSEAPPSEEDSFTDEMLVMEGLSSVQTEVLLASMKRNGISVPLKAVVTDTNRKWSASELHRQIRAEHILMTSSRPAKPRVHRKNGRGK